MVRAEAAACRGGRRCGEHLHAGAVAWREGVGPAVSVLLEDPMPLMYHGEVVSRNGR